LDSVIRRNARKTGWSHSLIGENISPDGTLGPVIMVAGVIIQGLSANIAGQIVDRRSAR
jgi:hypothetical protein